MVPYVDRTLSCGCRLSFVQHARDLKFDSTRNTKPLAQASPKKNTAIDPSEDLGLYHHDCLVLIGNTRFDERKREGSEERSDSARSRQPG